jgi:hypothetical protein
MNFKIAENLIFRRCGHAVWLDKAFKSSEWESYQRPVNLEEWQWRAGLGRCRQPACLEDSISFWREKGERERGRRGVGLNYARPQLRSANQVNNRNAEILIFWIRNQKNWSGEYRYLSLLLILNDFFRIWLIQSLSSQSGSLSKFYKFFRVV